MGKATAEPNGLEGWLYRVGYTSERIREVLHDARATAAELGERAAELPGDPAAPDEFDHSPRARAAERAADTAGEPLAALAAATALGTLVAQLVHPRRVDWPRAILAGTIGTLLYDAETVVEARRRQRNFGTSTAVRALLGTGDLRGQLGRYAAGIGMAGFYARYLHGRLPGPPLLQGALYGVLESATRGWGGPAALLGRLSPETPIPAGYTQEIARGTETPLQRGRRYLVFGVVVGLVYGAGRPAADRDR